MSAGEISPAGPGHGSPGCDTRANPAQTILALQLCLGSLRQCCLCHLPVGNDRGAGEARQRTHGGPVFSGNRDRDSCASCSRIFDLRAVQATDARRQFRFSQYLRLRIALTLAALSLIGAIVWFGRYDRRTAAVILAVAVAKAIETLSDIHYGLFQLNDRLDQTGRSMILRGVLSVSALAITLYFIPDVFWGCMFVALAWALALVLFDIRRGRQLLACTESLDGCRDLCGAHAFYRWLCPSALLPRSHPLISTCPDISFMPTWVSINWESSRRWLTLLSH